MKRPKPIFMNRQVSAQSALAEMIAELKAQTAALLEKAISGFRDPLNSEECGDTWDWHTKDYERSVLACISADQAAALADQEKRAEDKGWNDCLDEVRKSLSRYPALPCDIEIGAAVEHIVEIREKRAREARDEEWLLALLDTEHGGSWDLSKMEESVKRYRESIEKRARETALREVLEIVRVYRGSLGDLPRGEIMKRITDLLDAPGSRPEREARDVDHPV